MTAEQLALQILKRAIVRYGKVFLISGLSSAYLIPPVLHLSYHDVSSYVAAFVIAFFAGGIAGVEKLLTQIYINKEGAIKAAVPVIEKILIAGDEVTVSKVSMPAEPSSLRNQ